MRSSRPPRTDVANEDLAYLDRVHDLLLALNDPLASASKLGLFVDQIPVLAARLNKRLSPTRPPRKAAELLAAHGNRSLEMVLFELLEDLTELRGLAPA